MSNTNKIAIHGTPRSGTTWLGEILNSSVNVKYNFQPLFSYAFKDFLNNHSSKKNIDLFFKKLSKTEDEFVCQKDNRKQKKLPVFRKENITSIVYKEVRYHHILFNLMEKTDDIKLLLIIRNPLSTINSWLKAPKEFRKDIGWKEKEEWRYAFKKNLNKPEEFNGFEKWKEATNIFIDLKKHYPSKVYLLEYSSLLKQTIKKAKEIFNFCNLNYKQQTDDFLQISKNKENSDPYSVYKKKRHDNKWKKQLNKRIIKEIYADLKDTRLEQFLK